MKIVLAYKRRPELVNDIHLFDGYLEENKARVDLKSMTYAELIFALSERLRGVVLTPNDAVSMIRLEKADREFFLSSEEIETIREHPQTYIEGMTLPRQRVVLKLESKVSVTTKTSIRAGVDTLVESFGEKIYSRMRRGGGTECPRCGRWKALTMSRDSERGPVIVVKCNNCDFFGVAPSWFLTEDGGWVAFFVEDLLGLDVLNTPRFFFPREWNASGPWITREDLQQKYDRYVEEKENADRK